MLLTKSPQAHERITIMVLGGGGMQKNGLCQAMYCIHMTPITAQ